MIIKNKMKVILFLVFLLLWTMPLTALTIVVIRDQKFNAYNEAFAGFKQEIKKGKKQTQFVLYNLKKKTF